MLSSLKSKTFLKFPSLNVGLMVLSLNACFIGVMGNALAQANPYSVPYAELDADAVNAIQDLVPVNWQVVAISQGDLNRDGMVDFAVVLEAEQNGLLADFPAFVTLPPVLETLWERQAQKQAKPRRLMLVFGAKKGEPTDVWRYYEFLPTAPHEGEQEALAHIAILDQRLEFRFVNQTDVATGSQRLEKTYHFKTTPNDLHLVRFQQTMVNRRSGMFNELILNWEQAQREETFGSMSSPRHRKQQAAFKDQPSWSIYAIRDALAFSPTEVD